MAEPNLASAQFGGFWVRFLALVAGYGLLGATWIIAKTTVDGGR